MTSEKDNAKLGAYTIRAFLDQFGAPADPNVTLFLEVLLEELCSVKCITKDQVIFNNSSEKQDELYRQLPQP